MSPLILIIEDEPSIADALQYVLQGEGLLTTHVGTLQQARASIAQNTYDLLVLDVGLPDGNGFDFCREFRQKHSTPVLFLTARQEEIDRIIGLEIGGDDYVTKPFSPREVVARIKAILRRTQVATAPSPTLMNTANSAEKQQGIVPDLERACVWVHGQSIELTRNELLLLHHLQSHPGKVFSRRQLMNAVWEVPDSSMERTVDAHIKSVRKKIPTAPIVTHRGFGYSWQNNENTP